MFEFLELEESVGKFWHRLVGQTSSMPRYPDQAVTFDEVKPYLATCFRAFGGELTAQLGPAHARTSSHRLRLRQLVGLGEEKLAWAARGEGAMALPPLIDIFPERALNRDLYIWLAAYLALMPSGGVEPGDPLRADLARLDLASATVQHVLNAFPGLRHRYAALCRAGLAGRRRAVLPPVEKLVEARAIALLRRGAGLADEIMPAIFPAQAPVGYQPLLLVPLWPVHDLRPEASSTAETGDEGGSTAAAAAEGTGFFQGERETERDKSERSPFILNRFEKILAMAEMVNVDRPTDDSDDKNDDASRDLDEIRLGRRKERPSAKFRFDLDLPPEAVDTSSLEAENTYPEWNYRSLSYMPNYCRVISGPASLSETSEPQTADMRDLVRLVRRQFEILRPRHEILRAQVDGSELDLDAVVRMRADLASGGDGGNRIHLLSSPRGHDLAVTLLVDVSLSTDAWFDDHRVLDVEKKAVRVLAHGLSACDTHYSIQTFTSRRRDWVKIETVKAFDETMSSDVERRIEGLKPGYYTRIGAAIRHAHAELVKQPNRRKLLLILTDGKPNDIDHYEGRFALEDSRKAIAESRRAGTSVFAVTVDKDARSYLPAMFGRNGFAIVGHIGKLPQSLPAIYRSLTR
ncbi:protein norD [Rhizobium sp. Root149]|uniref:nitric oxide reductase activation protein NorD n=1 Tax=Rhizobium sp. Root149 TaxID=1736473 RepID=UPI000715ED2B|nr:VWA domain-containing protein [Rhizobium sp. Root149]KQZ47931.1 protein norD [Rhizobium sp. Root149]